MLIPCCTSLPLEYRHLPTLHAHCTECGITYISHHDYVYAHKCVHIILCSVICHTPCVRHTSSCTHRSPTIVAYTRLPACDSISVVVFDKPKHVSCATSDPNTAPSSQCRTPSTMKLCTHATIVVGVGVAHTIQSYDQHDLCVCVCHQVQLERLTFGHLVCCWTHAQGHMHL